MTEILFFDTETTGLVHRAMSPDHPDQPHIVQIAAMLTDQDGNVRSEISLIVNPGVDIPEGASKVHGIDTATATRLGCKPSLAVEVFKHLYDRADLLVAHNIAFDKDVLEIAITRDRGQRTTITRDLFCTMEAASPIVNIPPTERMVAAGITKPKPPRLEECIRHFFDESLDGAHDAMVDVRACARLYFHLAKLEKAA